MLMLTVPEVAKLAQASESTVYRWVYQKHLTVFKYARVKNGNGRTVACALFQRKAVEAFLASKPTQGRPRKLS